MDADGNYVVAWTAIQPLVHDATGLDVYARLFNADGTPRGTEFRVNPYTTGQQERPVVAMDADGDFVVAWASAYDWSVTNDRNFNVYARRYNAAGVAQGDPFRVNTETYGTQYPRSVGADAT